MGKLDPLTWQQERVWCWYRGELFWSKPVSLDLRMPLSIDLPREIDRDDVKRIATEIYHLSAFKTRVESLHTPHQTLDSYIDPPIELIESESPNAVFARMSQAGMALGNPPVRVGAQLGPSGRTRRLDLLLCHSAADGVAMRILEYRAIPALLQKRRLNETVSISDLISYQKGARGVARNRRAMSYNVRVLKASPTTYFPHFKSGSQSNRVNYRHISVTVPNLASLVEQASARLEVPAPTVLLSAIASLTARLADQPVFCGRNTFANRSAPFQELVACLASDGLFIIPVETTESIHRFLARCFSALLRSTANANYSSVDLRRVMDNISETRGDEMRFRIIINLFWNQDIHTTHEESAQTQVWEEAEVDAPDDSVDLQVRMFRQGSDLKLDVSLNASIATVEDNRKFVREMVWYLANIRRFHLDETLDRVLTAADAAT